MQIQTDRLPRKKYVVWLAILSILTMIGVALRFGKIKAPKMVKLLTRDGKLVEINAKLLAAYRKKFQIKSC